MAQRILNLKARKAHKNLIWTGLVWPIICFLICPFIVLFKRWRQSFIDGCLVHLFCDACGKYIPGNKVWFCGYCDFWNKKRSFLEHCDCCREPSQSYFCPHCEAVNFLEPGEDSTHPARFTPYLQNIETSDDKHKSKVRELEQEAEVKTKEIEVGQKEVEIAELTRKLEQLKESPAFKKKVSELERLRNDFNRMKANAMGVDMIIKEERAINKELYKDDPDGLEKAELLLQTFRNEKT